MCLAVPCLVKSVLATEAEVEVGGVSRGISIYLSPEVKVGDYVLVHTGFAINILDQRGAEETLELLRQLNEVYRRIP